MCVCVVPGLESYEKKWLNGVIAAWGTGLPHAPGGDVIFAPRTCRCGKIDPERVVHEGGEERLSFPTFTPRVCVGPWRRRRRHQHNVAGMLGDGVDVVAGGGSVVCRVAGMDMSCCKRVWSC